MEKIRAIIGDEQAIVRAGLRAMLQGTEVEIVAEAQNGAEVMEAVQQHQPQIVVLDVRMPGGDGLNALGRIKLSFPKVAVIMFSAYENPRYVAQALALGAAGYIFKGVPRADILSVIRAAAAGQTVWSRGELRRVTGALAAPRLATDVEVPLTQRESEVLEKVAKGLTNKQIAAAMNISYETVKEHVQHILSKIGVSDRTQAAVWAVREGVI